MTNRMLTAVVLAALLGSSAVSEGADSLLRVTAQLSGAQENPQTPGPARGELYATFDQQLTSLTVNLTIGLINNVTAAHFHCARPGLNGPIVFGLFSPGNLQLVNGSVIGTLTNADFTGGDCTAGVGRPVNNIAALAFAIRDGLVYINVHTSAFPGGEIRGQVRPIDSY